jgi:hypothetical protein
MKRYRISMLLSITMTIGVPNISIGASLSTFYRGTGWDVVVTSGQYTKTCLIQSADEQIGYNIWGRPPRFEILFVLRHKPSSSAGKLEVRVPGLATRASVPYIVTPQNAIIAYANQDIFRYLGRVPELEVMMDAKTYHLNSMVPVDVLSAYRQCVGNIRK